MTDVSVIIVSWNTKALLRACLHSVYEQTRKYKAEVWVVDNNSPDKSADMVAEEFPQVHLIANPDNKGFAGGNVQAMNLATGKYILLLNPDTIVLDGAIDKMIDYAEVHKNDKIGVITCKLLNDDLTLQKSVNSFYSFWGSFIENRFISGILAKMNIEPKGFTSYWDHSTEREIDWAYGAVMLFSKELMDKVGVLDENFFIYAEEMDYFLRVRKAGYRSVFLPDIEIIHLGKSSSRQKRAAMFIQNYKSFYLFLKKHYSGLSYFAYRLRATIYLLLWYIRFSFGNSDESKEQKKVYAETLKWHFSAESFDIKTLK
ncbi:MAG: glycosyltransferase family 2 protein [Bacteroidota bacterium]